MIGAKKHIASLSALLAMTITVSSFTMAQAAMEPGGTTYVPTSAQDVEHEARIALDNACAAGRLDSKAAANFSQRLASASSLSDVEKTWGELEAAAQVAKADHVSLEHLISQFLSHLGDLEKKGIITPAMGGNFYRDRIAGIQRIKKQVTAKDHFFDFWEFVMLAIDLSSVQDRLTRALAESHPDLETLDDLILRTDNYLLRNDVAARMLTTYKSFEVEPDNLLASKADFYSILRDKANSRVATPEVKRQLFERLKAIQYEAAKSMPTEQEVSTGITEVQRLLNSGARNGNLNAFDDVRMQHELELIKELKQAYPGPNPGIDPIERELRMEEVRFMSLDLRFLQDWLGRVLRKDGEVIEAREQVLRAVRRIDLALFSHRIRKEEALGLLSDISNAMRDSRSETELATRCRALEAKMDMMISDFSMVPAKNALRAAYISQLLDQLRIEHDAVASDLQRIQGMVASVKDMPEGSQKYGASIVAAYELERLRNQVRSLLKMQNVMTPTTSERQQMPGVPFRG